MSDILKSTGVSLSTTIQALLTAPVATTVIILSGGIQNDTENPITITLSITKQDTSVIPLINNLSIAAGGQYSFPTKLILEPEDVLKGLSSVSGSPVSINYVEHGDVVVDVTQAHTDAIAAATSATSAEGYKNAAATSATSAATSASETSTEVAIESEITRTKLRDSIAGQGPGYYFNGIDDKILIPSITLDLNNSSIISFLKKIGIDSGIVIGSSITNTKSFFRVLDGALSIESDTGGNTQSAAISFGSTPIQVGFIGNEAIGAFYVNGKTAETTGSPFTDNLTIDQIGLAVTGSYPFYGAVYSILLFNLSLPEDEFEAFSNGGPIPYKYQGASQTPIYESNFSVNDDGFSQYQGAYFAGNIDGVSDGSVSKDNVLKYTPDGGVTSHYVWKTLFSEYIGKQVKVEFSYYIPSTNTNVNGMVSYLTDNEPTNYTAGSWQNVSYEGLLNRSDFRLLQTATGVENFAGANSSTDDIIYITGIKVTLVGCVLNLNPDGITESEWVDSSGNGNNGAVTGAKAFNLNRNRLAFPAIAVPSSDPNTLDDYEEGSYTATLTCSTSGTITLNGAHNTLSYKKIGNLVHVQGRLLISAINAPLGSLRLGLPFTGGTLPEDQDLYGGSGVAYYSIVALGSGGALSLLQLSSGQSYVPIVELTTTAWSDDVANHIQADTQLVFSFHFLAE